MTPIHEFPEIKYLGDSRWQLITDLEYVHSKYGVITVEAGFKTDLDSVPRIPLAYWLTKNVSVTGAVVHDWLYRKGHIKGNPITRKEADQIFRDVMEEEGVSWWRRALIYRGVRIGASGPWDKYRDEELGV